MTFLEVVRGGSFSQAARQLNLAVSVVTKRIDQLEWRTKSKLFERSTRKLVLTDEGRRLLPAAQRIVQDVNEALDSLHGRAARLDGHLRVKVPTTLAVFHLSAVLARFQQLHSNVSLEVIVLDRPVNPIHEGFDVAIGMLPSSFDEVTEIGLSPLNRFAAASPGYLQTNGIPHHPTDLTQHRLLNFQPVGSSWAFTGPHGPINVDITPHLSTNDGHVLLDAAVAGNGIALFASYMATAALQRNELQLVLEDFPVPQFWIRDLVPNSRMHLTRVQAFLTFVQAAFAEDGWLVPD